MREHLYIGKNPTIGKWVEGCYYEYTDVTYCIKEDYDAHPENTHHVILTEEMTDWGLPNRHLKTDVIPETVGEYTGRLDKYHARIYEGQVVRVLYTDWMSKPADDPRSLDEYLLSLTKLGVVTWDGAGWAILIGDELWPIDPGTHGYIIALGMAYDHPEVKDGIYIEKDLNRNYY